VSRLNGMTYGKAGERIIELYRRTMGVTLYASLPVYGILVVIAPALLRVWLGEAFLEELPAVFRITLAASFVSVLTVPAWYMLLGLGSARSALLGHSICVGVHLIGVLAFAAFLHTVKPWQVAVAFLIGIIASSAYVVRQQRSWCQRLRALPQENVPQARDRCSAREYGPLHPRRRP